jgi:hypothetical protein
LRWLSSFALLLYFALLCTPQAFAVHDARLSPLADKQFHAVTPTCQEFVQSTEQDSSDEPQPVLPTTLFTDIRATSTFAAVIQSGCNKPAFLFAQQARAPPQIFHT